MLREELANSRFKRQGFFKWLEKRLNLGYDGPVLFWSDFKDRVKKDSYAVYNTENLSIKGKLTKEYRAFLAGADVVYDYSYNNLEYWPSAIYKPVEVGQINKWSTPKAIQYLFYGMLTPRRRDVVTSLGATYIDGIHGKELEQYIRRSEYVISLGAWGNTHNDSMRQVMAIEAGATVLAERTLDPYDIYINKYDVILMSYENLLNYEEG